MKREINCTECAKTWAKLAGTKSTDNPFDVAFRHYQGERLKQVRGGLTRHCLCDQCGKELAPGTEVVAVSVYTDQTPYFEWEGEFIATPA